MYIEEAGKTSSEKGQVRRERLRDWWIQTSTHFLAFQKLGGKSGRRWEPLNLVYTQHSRDTNNGCWKESCQELLGMLLTGIHPVSPA